jgi:hypothetical protein
MIDGMPWVRQSVDLFNNGAWSPASRNRVLMTAAL